MPQSSGVQYPAGETGEERTHILVPGAIIADKGSAHVVCGDGKRLALAEVQLENKRRVPIAECLNGLKLQAGESFT
jgi:methionyl-tRNA formyltransferase